MSESSSLADLVGGKDEYQLDTDFGFTAMKPLNVRFSEDVLKFSRKYGLKKQFDLSSYNSEFSEVLASTEIYRVKPHGGGAELSVNVDDVAQILLSLNYT